MPSLASWHHSLLMPSLLQAVQPGMLLGLALVVRLWGAPSCLPLPLALLLRWRLRASLLALLRQSLQRRAARQRRAVLPLRAGRARGVPLQVTRKRVLGNDRGKQRQHLARRLHLPAWRT